MITNPGIPNKWKNRQVGQNAGLAKRSESKLKCPECYSSNTGSAGGGGEHWRCARCGFEGLKGEFDRTDESKTALLIKKKIYEKS